LFRLLVIIVTIADLVTLFPGARIRGR